MTSPSFADYLGRLASVAARRFPGRCADSLPVSLRASRFSFFFLFQLGYRNTEFLVRSLSGSDLCRGIHIIFSNNHFSQPRPHAGHKLRAPCLSAPRLVFQISRGRGFFSPGNYYGLSLVYRLAYLFAPQFT